ncbi:hypothetical protein SMSP2_02052 [Limihaloglobus sulfuriphilus]|uniref:Uncharacterized protein n=1 Tax=Limihaloglobus sulfuriphilus TaxID=1851148 RepID=A0A1Q2MG53_9BACT|nr:hypothetical protein SMSP2_02052 [Limihaloglobus sulfuriphilus]
MKKLKIIFLITISLYLIYALLTGGLYVYKEKKFEELKGFDLF